MVRFLADEQNSVDQNVKGKSHQQYIKSFRMGMQVISDITLWLIHFYFFVIFLLQALTYLKQNKVTYSDFSATHVGEKGPAPQTLLALWYHRMGRSAPRLGGGRLGEADGKARS